MALKDPLVNIPTKQSTANIWKQWHMDLKNSFGRKTANSLWIAAWEQGKSSLANTMELRSYMEENGFEIQTDLMGNLVDSGGDLLDYVSDVFTMSKYAAVGLAVIIIIPVFILLVNVARDPKGTIAVVSDLKGGTK